MTLFDDLRVIVWAAAFVFGGGLGAEVADPLRVLYFTRSAGWEHEVVKWTDGKRSHSEKVLEKMAADGRFDFTFSKDGSLFSAEYFEQFDVILFYTSGDLSSSGGDGHPPVSPEGKEALLAAIAGGKGFVGLHSAADSWHTGECGAGNPRGDARANRYRLHGDESDPYIRMLGGEFIVHGRQQQGVAAVIDPSFPGFEGLGGELALFEEWYSTKEFRDDLHILLVLETEGMEGAAYQRPPYPIGWARTHGAGRVCYLAIGHREDVWDNPTFQHMLNGGLLWAGGRADADLKPNGDSVAPGADVLPPRE